MSRTSAAPSRERCSAASDASTSCRAGDASTSRCRESAAAEGPAERTTRAVSVPLRRTLGKASATGIVTTRSAADVAFSCSTLRSSSHAEYVSGSASGSDSTSRKVPRSWSSSSRGRPSLPTVESARSGAAQ